MTVEQSHCDSVMEYRVYLVAPTDTEWQFLGAESSMHRVVQNIDPFYNYTVGVSVVNNAGLESEKSEIMYIGSKCDISDGDGDGGDEATQILHKAASLNFFANITQ